MTYLFPPWRIVPSLTDQFVGSHENKMHNVLHVDEMSRSQDVYKWCPLFRGVSVFFQYVLFCIVFFFGQLSNNLFILFFSFSNYGFWLLIWYLQTFLFHATRQHFPNFLNQNGAVNSVSHFTYALINLSFRTCYHREENIYKRY